MAAAAILHLSLTVCKSEETISHGITKHTVECIRNIASQYLNDSDSLTVVIPMFLEDTAGKRLNFQWNTQIHLLLTELHGLESSPMFVTRLSGMEKLSLKLDDYRKEANYVIILKDPGNCKIKEIVLTLARHIESVALLPSWNSRARFIVVVTPEDCGLKAAEVAQSLVEVEGTECDCGHSNIRNLPCPGFVYFLAIQTDTQSLHHRVTVHISSITVPT